MWHISYGAKTHNARLPEHPKHPTKKHVELVAYSETENTGLKKGPGLHALRGLCATVGCASLRDYSAPVVSRQFLAPPLLRYNSFSFEKNVRHIEILFPVSILIILPLSAYYSASTYIVHL